MDGGNEHRVAIIFCFKAGLSATGTLVLAQKAYGNDALNQPKVFRWYSRFRDGRELVENDERVFFIYQNVAICPKTFSNNIDRYC
jgi:hypothetical protein